MRGYSEIARTRNFDQLNWLGGINFRGEEQIIGLRALTRNDHGFDSNDRITNLCVLRSWPLGK